MEPAECVWVSRHELPTGGYQTHIHGQKLHLNCNTLHQHHSALERDRMAQGEPNQMSSVGFFLFGPFPEENMFGFS